MSKGKITKRQKDALVAMKRFHRKHGYYPTLEELGIEMGGIQPRAAWNHVKGLDKAGYIIRRTGIKGKHVPRAITIVGTDPTYLPEQCPFCKIGVEKISYQPPQNDEANDGVYRDAECENCGGLFREYYDIAHRDTELLDHPARAGLHS